VGALAYQRGELLALRWHEKLSEHSAEGLDGVMRSLLLLRKVEENAKPASPLATMRLLDALDAGKLETARDDVERYIERGESFPFDGGSLGPCFDMRREDKPALRLGFDRRSVKEGRLIGVEIDGPAYAAGLRDGQPINGFWMFDGDVSKDVHVVLRHGDAKTSEVAYRPVALERRSIPVYAPKPDAAADPACRAWFGLGAATR
jgi:predicted metalloprotease with PDZ domain